jgi:nitroreductase
MKSDSAETLGSEPAAFDRLLAARSSCRGFLPGAVPRELIERILQTAQRTPSWNNTQPWQIIVTQPAATEKLRRALQQEEGQPPGFEIEPPHDFQGVYLERRRACGWGLYASVGIAKGDREASARQASENFRMFGAPHVAIVTTEKRLGGYTLVDCGAWVNNFLLACTSHGVASIAQAALALRSPVLRRQFDIAADRQIVCGISFGYADPQHPANRFRTTRASLAEVVRWAEE